MRHWKLIAVAMVLEAMFVYATWEFQRPLARLLYVAMWDVMVTVTGAEDAPVPGRFLPPGEPGVCVVDAC